MHPINRAAREGFADAGQLYEKARPEYPPQAIAALLGHLRLAPGTKVLDLAAGTGKLTRHLPETGAEVTAVEPVAGMREKFSALLPGIPILEGMAESLPFPDSSFDAVTVATAFHWFRAEEAYREIARVLKPGGRLALIWNTWNPARRPAWLSAIRDLIEPYGEGTPRYAGGEWKKPFETPRLFTPLEFTAFDHPLECSFQSVVDRMLSISFVAALPPETRETLAREMKRILDEDPDLRGRDTVVLPYQADVFRTSRIRS
jgi:SAM-dependent methyltransferase